MKRLFAGIFLISLSTLIIELCLIRAFDALFLPNIAYMIVTCALFAFGLSGIYAVFRLPFGAINLNYHSIIYLLPTIFLFLFFFSGCEQNTSLDEAESKGPLLSSHSMEIQIPEQSEWVDHGLILERGSDGDWDYYLGGAFVGTVVKKDGVFYLYYQGANGYDKKYDTVTYRAIGVATSRDGINFTKHNKSPIINWFPNNWLEEGAFSGGATLMPNGEIVMYYGAMSKQSDLWVNADGRLAVSTDGLNFTDHGVVLDHQNKAVWGSGDELFPIIAFQAKGNWYVYYIPNGTSERHKLGIAWGPSRNRLINSAPAIANGKKIEVWGRGGYAKIGIDLYALFINVGSKKRMEVRIVYLNYPDRLGEPIRIYEFEDITGGIVYLDLESNSWFMFYLNKNRDRYGVKKAPIQKIDDR